MAPCVTTIYSQGDSTLTLWLPSRCRDPWSSRGWSFTRYKDNFVTKRSSLQASIQSVNNKIFTDKTIVNSSVEGWHIPKNHHFLSVFSLFLHFRLQFLFQLHAILTPTCLSCSHEEPRSCQFEDRAVWQSPCLRKDQLTRMGSCTVVRLGNREAVQQAEAA